SYRKEKGSTKYQSRSRIEGTAASIDGLSEIASFDAFYVVDTNTETIQGVKVSAAYFIACRLKKARGGFQLVCPHNRSHCYEFHGITGNPEMLAILKIANDIRTGSIWPRHFKIGFFNDSEMEAHEAISLQRQPIYGTHYLPSGMSLMYASADTGRDLPNRLIKVCNNAAARYLQRLKDGPFRTSGLQTLGEDPSIKFRYTYYPGLTVTDDA